MRHGFLVLVTLFALLCSARAHATEGRTPGQFAVSSSGGAQYSIPIWTPPGPRGIQPHMALVYDSQSGIGTVGVGWHLAGLGAITRCTKTYAQDTIPAAVALATADGYCINGNRMRLTGGNYGTAGSTYQTEIADFSNITAVNTAGSGPSYFTVQGRDGLTYEYGYTANGYGTNSQVLATGTSTASAWLLSKVFDPAGNSYVVNYTTLTGAAVPSTIEWTPTTAGGTTYTYTMQFNYTTNAPPSSLTKYIGGTAVSNTKLLSSIEILYGSTVVKDYFLGYQASPTTGRDELISVKECADSAQSNCLLPTAITYQNGAAGVSATSTTALSSGGSGLTHYDFNGDGYPDIVYNPTGNGAWYVSFGSATGYGAPVNTGITGTALFGNVTGGNKDGILVAKSGVWWYYTWNGSSFTGASTGLAVDSTSYGFQLADIDGDGRPDLIDLDVVYNSITKQSSGYVYTRLNTSTGSTASFSSTLTLSYSTGIIAGAQLQTPDQGGSKLRRYDFDGDGRDDLVLQVIVGSGSYSVETFELLSTGTAFTATLIATSPGGTYPPVFFTNWNDDACTDFVSFNSATSATLYVSGCNGTVPATYSVGNVVAAMDWDGDGRTDLVVVNGSNLGVYLSTGGAPGTLLATSIPYSSTCGYVTMDANGDGLDDLGCESQTSPYPLTYRLHNGAGQPPDLVSSIKDGYGNSASPTYVSLVQSNYTQYTDAVFPDQNYIGPLCVVSEAVFSDPSNMPNGTYNQIFWYYGAWVNLQGRGFEAFYAKRMIDSRNGLYNFQYYERAFPETGMDFEDDLSNNSAAQISYFIRTPAVTTLSSATNEERYFPYFSNVTSEQWELGGTENGDLVSTTSTNYTYDNYGNATTVATTVTDNDPGSPYVNDTWTSTTVNTITPDTTTWCLSLPTETQVTSSSTAPGGTAITRTVTYTPDYTNCRETQKVIEPGSSTYKVTDAYTYDAFGNLWTDTMTGVGMTARETITTWGTTGQFLTTVTNPLSQVITMGYDPGTGNKTSQTDPNWTSSNPIATTWGYDPFQRKSSELRPDGTSTTWGYNACGSNCVNSNNQMTVTASVLNVGGTTQSVTNTYLDSLDRPLVTSSMMLNGAYDRHEVQYDNLGRVHQQGAPCTFVSCTNYWTTNTYDVLNRLTQSQRPISATNNTLQTTTYAYAGRTTTVTDALNNVTSHINLVTGPLARSKDANGYYVSFTYDAFGARLSVTDSASNTLHTNTYQYGLKAFKTASTDMDLGPRSYTVDALGEVTAYSDNKSQNFSVIYDALSRPTTRTEPPDLTTTWVWGNTASSYNIGKLQSVTGADTAGSYVDAYVYDSKTRLSTRTLTLPGDASYVYTYTYNATTGFLDTLQYPVSTSSYQLKLQYTYLNGILQQVSDAAAGTHYWTANTTNPRGQITQETLGNGVITNRAYDAVTSWIGTIQAGSGGGYGLLNSAYTFDYMGNVTQRQDNNLGLTENFYYDADYRLDHSMLNNTLNLQMVYDATGMGNIASRSDVAGGATWTYDPVRKHAVTQAGSSAYTYTYDGNGNAATRNGYTVSWTSYNYPSAISSSGESTTFQYGPSRDRWQTFYTGSIGNETTYHVGKLLEKVVNGGSIDYRHYIYAGAELVAVSSRMNNGTNTLHYTLEDHQDSIAGILTSAGTTDVNESFTAFGNRRSAETWSGPPTSGDETAINGVSRWGYTGQTVLGVSMGLNHMNGRVEDAITGRFLSPDPHGINPYNTQSYNRYSYVGNNPMTLTDPTGFQQVKLVCNEYCSLPAGISHFSPQVQQKLLSHLGFIHQFVGDAPGSNTSGGDGGWGNFSFNNPDPAPPDASTTLFVTLTYSDANVALSGDAAPGGNTAPAVDPPSGDGAQSQANDDLEPIKISSNVQYLTVAADGSIMPQTQTIGGLPALGGPANITTANFNNFEAARGLGVYTNNQYVNPNLTGTQSVGGNYQTIIVAVDVNGDIVDSGLFEGSTGKYLGDAGVSGQSLINFMTKNGYCCGP